MTPNPNPSPELLQRARQIVADAKYDDPTFHALVMDGSMDFEMVDFVLAGMAEPQALPAPGEVEVKRKRNALANVYRNLNMMTTVAEIERGDWDHTPEIASLATVAAANDEGVAHIIEQEAVGIITDLIGPQAAQSGTICRVVEDHLRQFIRLLSQGGGGHD